MANKLELCIDTIKESVKKDVKESDCPLHMWDYCLERRVRIHNLTAKGRFNLHDSNAHANILNETEAYPIYAPASGSSGPILD